MITNNVHVELMITNKVHVEFIVILQLISVLGFKYLMHFCLFFFDR